MNSQAVAKPLKREKSILWLALLSALGVLSGNRSGQDCGVPYNTHNITHNEQYSKVIRPSEFRDTHVYVLWVKPMILETMVQNKNHSNKMQIGHPPEEQDACRSTDLIVWDDVAKLFPDITDAVEKRIQTLCRSQPPRPRSAPRY